MAASEAVKLERERRKTAREERVWKLLTDPTVKRLLLLSGIVAYTSYINSNPGRYGVTADALAVALPTAGVPMLAAEAGITDWKVLGALALACGGLAAVTNRDIVEGTTLEMPGTGQPLASLFGPIPALQWSWRKAQELGL